MGRTITKVERHESLASPLRVAAYARVSCGKDEMLHSLAAQVSHYAKWIQSNPGWLYQGVYADEALTGTKDSRPAFQQLLVDCRAGQIDAVITKSISRFARNTITLLEVVRELKTIGVDVFFEEQNIHTQSADGELLLTILAGYAQEESRSVSENCTWRIRKGFEQGVPVPVPLYGYRWDGRTLVPVPEEAAIVRQVFDWYMAGEGILRITKRLRREGILTREGKSWDKSLVARILTNEKYAGDLLLQKTYTTDHLSKKTKENRGALPRFFVSGSHEGIVDRATFDAVQFVMKEHGRHLNPPAVKPVYPFTGKLICGNCGKHYRRKTTHGKVSWQCNTYLERGKAACPAQQIPETTLEALCVEALSGEALSTKTTRTDASCKEALTPPTFDPTTFETRIHSLLVLQNHQVKIQFTDSTETTLTRQPTSRRDSWTPSMKAAAATRTKERHTHG